MAIRTMSYMQVEQVLESLVIPLRHAIRDKDPYVRKTAAMAVLKLCMHDRALAEEENFLNMLKGLLADPNPSVVANAVAALVEISERSPNIKLKLNMKISARLIAALNECNEWGQVYILESLMYIIPQQESDAESIIERITPRLQHSNASVVLTAVKVIIYMMNYISNIDELRRICKKMSPPLVTLLNSGFEVQYITLRNIQLILQRWPTVLDSQLRDFFCKYDDPIYVKLAKLEIILRLTTESNVAVVLSELAEYASEVDVDFVRKAVRSIGRVAIKIESVADSCIETLMSLIQTKVNYVLQEAIIVIRDIFRKYPNRYEGVIGTLCENLDHLDEPEARAAMVWIIGQYADRIDRPEEVLEGFLDKFLDEPAEVQLALLTATIKLFITRPTAGQDLVPKVLKWATEDVDNPDLRDRGFIYWRLLSTDPEAAREIVLSDKPKITTEADNMDPLLLEELLLHASTLSALYHKPPNMFINSAKRRALPESAVLHRLRVDLPESSPSVQGEPQRRSEVGVPAPSVTGESIDSVGIEADQFGASPLVLSLSTASRANQNMQSLNPYLDNVDGALRAGSNYFGGTEGKDGQGQQADDFGVFDSRGGGQGGATSANMQDLLGLDLLGDAQATSAVNIHGMTGFANSFSDVAITPMSVALSASDAGSAFSARMPAPGRLGTASSNSNNNSSGPTTDQTLDRVFGSLSLEGTSGDGNVATQPTTLRNAFTNSFSPTAPLFRPENSLAPTLSPSSSGIDTLTKSPAIAPLASQVTEIMWSSLSPTAPNPTTGQAALHVPSRKVLLAGQQASGLEIVGTFARRQGQMQMELTFANRGAVPLGDFAIQFNSNYFGIVPAAPLMLPVAQLLPGSTCETVLPLMTGGPTQLMTPVTNLQVAIKCTLGIFYFQTQYSFHILFVEDGKLEQNAFLQLWRTLPDQQKQTRLNQQLPLMSIDDIRNKLNMNNVFTVAQRQISHSINFYVCAKLGDGTVFVSEVKFENNFGTTTATTKSNNPALIDAFQIALLDILAASSSF
ncbi:hypothetical protein EV182_001344 [Spiromyces aspiralis]|uniref:Uncharacterized protein n=1 Tax=Spiromyces aspiralis TaxID=68401 RepID=A0ACC1HJA0_9FUNG|nr:hypothetical protein EV182_001344 [Spiromyces aspiralis]